MENKINNINNYNIQLNWCRVSWIETYTLIKLSISASTHWRIVPSIHFCNLIPFDTGDLAHGNKTGKRNSQIIAHGKNFSSLIFQVINEFGIFTIFASQNFLENRSTKINQLCFLIQVHGSTHFQFEYWCVNSFRSMFLEYFHNFVEDFPSNCHLVGQVVSCTLGGFEDEFPRRWCIFPKLKLQSFQLINSLGYLKQKKNRKFL